MRTRGQTKIEDAEYLKSGRWKCEKSPTGAHYFIGNREKRVFICKYCSATKPLLTEQIVPSVETDVIQEAKT